MRDHRALDLAGPHPGLHLPQLREIARPFDRRYEDLGLAVLAEEGHPGRSQRVGLHLHPTPGAHHGGRVGAFGAHRARPDPGDTVGVSEQQRGAVVHTVGRQTAHDVDRVGVPEQGLDQRHRIRAEVQQRTAAQRRVEQPVGGVVGKPEAEIIGHAADLTQLTLGDQLPELHVQGIEARPDRLHQERVVGARRSDDGLGQVQVDGQRFLGQHRRPGLERRDRRLVVHTMGCRHVEHVDLRQHVGQVLEHGRRGRTAAGREAQPLREGRSPFGRSGADRHEFRVGQQRQVGHHRAGDAARADHSPAQRPTGHRGSRSPAHRGSSSLGRSPSVGHTPGCPAERSL